jgi:hypothetical protein
MGGAEKIHSAHMPNSHKQRLTRTCKTSGMKSFPGSSGMEKCMRATGPVISSLEIRRRHDALSEWPWSEISKSLLPHGPANISSIAVRDQDLAFRAAR